MNVKREILLIDIEGDVRLKAIHKARKNYNKLSATSTENILN